MNASKFGSVASMQKLLELKCDPDLLDNAGDPALVYAIMSEVSAAVHFLLHTSQGLKSCITKLAMPTSIPMSDEIKIFMEETTKNSTNLFLTCFEENVKYGNVLNLNFLIGRNKKGDEVKLLNNDTEVKYELMSIMPTLITHSIYSDDHKVCEIVLELCHHLDY